MAMAHMHAGGASVIVPRFDAEEAVRLIDRHRVTHLSDFPPVLATLLDAAEKPGSALREPDPRLRPRLAPDHPAPAREDRRPVLDRLRPVRDERVRHHPARGRAAGRLRAAGARAQVRLVDDYDREVPSGTPGEIVVRGPLVFQGYFGQPDVTAYTFRNGWHHTGDVGRFDADGYLHYVKRKPEKELIKPGGENVYPAEVETVIMQMAGVTGVCVYGIPDAKWGEAIKAVVEVAAPGAHTAQQVTDFVGGKIARFKRPHVVMFTRRPAAHRGGRGGSRPRGGRGEAMSAGERRPT